LNRNLRPDFEAARADARTDRDFQILRPAAKCRFHRFDSLRRNLGYNSAPPGVNGSHGPCSWIHNDDREAVRGSNRDCHTRLLGNESVPWAKVTGVRGL